MWLFVRIYEVKGCNKTEALILIYLDDKLTLPIDSRVDVHSHGSVTISRILCHPELNSMYYNFKNRGFGLVLFDFLIYSGYGLNLRL